MNFLFWKKSIFGDFGFFGKKINSWKEKLMSQNFGNLDKVDYQKLKDLGSVLRYCCGNTDLSYLVQIMTNLSENLNNVFDHILG